MTSVRRKRKRLWKSVLTALTLGTTLPALALLCRGHSPSRFDVANLPVWERTTPTAPKPLGRTVETALPASKVRFASLPFADTLLNADENRMFATLEMTRGLPGNRLDAGKPGVWLEQASVIAHWSPVLAAKMDRVAKRLMNAADNNGYMGAISPARAYTARDIAAHSNNLRGLLAYYELTHQPAALYAAIRAGDFLLDSYDPWPGHEEPGAEDALVYALTRLYSDCGSVNFLQFAEREEVTRGCDGLGLCALYEATGDKHFLAQAEQTWKMPKPRITNADAPQRGEPSPQFSAEIFKLTGNAKYLAGVRDGNSIWPTAVAYTRSASGLNVNCLIPATIEIGTAHLNFTTYVRKAAETSPTLDTTTHPAVKNHLGTVVADVDVKTNSHTASTVHIDFAPGCIPSEPNQPVLIAVNGKHVDYRQSTGARLALRATPLVDEAQAHKSVSATGAAHNRPDPAATSNPAA